MDFERRTGTFRKKLRCGPSHFHKPKNGSWTPRKLTKGMQCKRFEKQDLITKTVKRGAVGTLVFRVTCRGA